MAHPQPHSTAGREITFIYPVNFFFFFDLDRVERIGSPAGVLLSSKALVETFSITYCNSDNSFTREEMNEHLTQEEVKS